MAEFAFQNRGDAGEHLMMESIVASCITGDAESVKMNWKPQFLPISSRLGPNDTYHPLLHAAHRLHVEIVRFLLDEGLSPRLRGTVHPYTGDCMTVSELQGINPLDLVSKMLFMNPRKSKRRDALLAVQELLERADAQIRAREEENLAKQKANGGDASSKSLEHGLMTPLGNKSSYGADNDIGSAATTAATPSQYPRRASRVPPSASLSVSSISSRSLTSATPVDQKSRPKTISPMASPSSSSGVDSSMKFSSPKSERDALSAPEHVIKKPRVQRTLKMDEFNSPSNDNLVPVLTTYQSTPTPLPSTTVPLSSVNYNPLPPNGQLFSPVNHKIPLNPYATMSTFSSPILPAQVGQSSHVSVTSNIINATNALISHSNPPNTPTSSLKNDNSATLIKPLARLPNLIGGTPLALPVVPSSTPPSVARNLAEMFFYAEEDVESAFPTKSSSLSVNLNSPSALSLSNSTRVVDYISKATARLIIPRQSDFNFIAATLPSLPPYLRAKHQHHLNPSSSTCRTRNVTAVCPPSLASALNVPMVAPFSTQSSSLSVPVRLSNFASVGALLRRARSAADSGALLNAQLHSMGFLSPISTTGMVTYDLSGPKRDDVSSIQAVFGSSPAAAAAHDLLTLTDEATDSIALSVGHNNNIAAEVEVSAHLSYPDLFSPRRRGDSLVDCPLPTSQSDSLQDANTDQNSNSTPIKEKIVVRPRALFSSDEDTDGTITSNETPDSASLPSTIQRQRVSVPLCGFPVLPPSDLQYTQPVSSLLLILTQNSLSTSGSPNGKKYDADNAPLLTLPSLSSSIVVSTVGKILRSKKKEYFSSFESNRCPDASSGTISPSAINNPSLMRFVDYLVNSVNAYTSSSFHLSSISNAPPSNASLDSQLSSILSSVIYGQSNAFRNAVSELKIAVGSLFFDSLSPVRGTALFYRPGQSTTPNSNSTSPNAVNQYAVLENEREINVLSQNALTYLLQELTGELSLPAHSSSSAFTATSLTSKNGSSSNTGKALIDTPTAANVTESALEELLRDSMERLSNAVFNALMYTALHNRGTAVTTATGQKYSIRCDFSPVSSSSLLLPLVQKTPRTNSNDAIRTLNKGYNASSVATQAGLDLLASSAVSSTLLESNDVEFGHLVVANFTLLPRFL